MNATAGYDVAFQMQHARVRGEAADELYSSTILIRIQKNTEEFYEEFYECKNSVGMNFPVVVERWAMSVET